MKTEKNILIAFLLNLVFSVFELFGGVITGSVAILSDAVHDLGDAVSIGIAYFLEKKSRKQPDSDFTYGYSRYSVIGSVITTLILLLGSAAVIANAVKRLISPAEISYDGMIVFAVVGSAVNFIAALSTRHGESLNQRAVNLHMLEDVLGWIVVLIGAVVMKFTDFVFIDPLLSIGVAVFILINALRNLKEAVNLFLERIPPELCVEEIKEHILNIDGVRGVHHIHLWSMDGHSHYATMHIVADGDPHEIKAAVRAELSEHGIGHATLELETVEEHCGEEHCHTESSAHLHHGHAHHGH